MSDARTQGPKLLRVVLAASASLVAVQPLFLGYLYLLGDYRARSGDILRLLLVVWGAALAGAVLGVLLWGLQRFVPASTLYARGALCGLGLSLIGALSLGVSFSNPDFWALPLLGLGLGGLFVATYFLMDPAAPRPKLAPRYALVIASLIVMGGFAILFRTPQVQPPKPRPPHALPAPRPPPATIEGKRLSELRPEVLGALSRRSARTQDYVAALIFQYWAVQVGGKGRYNLACWYSLAGDVEGAIYWLQKAAMLEGVDADWAVEDPDLASVRKQSRWWSLLRFLEASALYWRHSGLEKAALVVPSGYDPREPIPLLIGLHGLGGEPERFVAGHQAFADAHRIAVLGVSGSHPIGPKSFTWSEDPAVDRARVDRALLKARSKLSPKPGAVILMGFSQGAQMALELAARDPKVFAGAIAFSPGLRGDSQLKSSTPAPGQRFVISVGGGEHPSNVDLAAQAAQVLSKKGASVKHLVDSQQRGHTLPRGYLERLPGWIEFILGAAREEE